MSVYFDFVKLYLTIFYGCYLQTYASKSNQSRGKGGGKGRRSKVIKIEGKRIRKQLLIEIKEKRVRKNDPPLKHNKLTIKKKLVIIATPAGRLMMRYFFLFYYPSGYI